MLRKCATSVDVIGERAAKWMRSLRPSAVSPVLSSAVADVAERARRSEEWTSTCALMGPVPTPGSQPKEALPAVGVVEQSGRSEE